MNRRELLLSSLGLGVLPVESVLGQNAPQKWALLIGINDYDDADHIAGLGAANADAKGIRKTLIEALSFPAGNVQVLTSDATERQRPTKKNILEALTRLKSRARPGDLVFVLYAGHGMEIRGKSYLLPYDTSGLSDDDIVDTALESGKFQERLREVSAGLLLLCFDMCRSNPIKEKRDARSDNALDGKTRGAFDFSGAGGGAKKAARVVTLFACSEGERAYEDRLRSRGYFSYFLEQGLRGGAATSQGTVTVGSLTAYLSAEVPKASDGKQTPYPIPAGPGATEVVLRGGLIPTTDPDEGKTERLDTRARLALTGLPPGAKVTVDEVAVSLANGEATINLGLDKERTVEVAVSASGYEPGVYSAKLVRGKRTPLKVALDKKEPVKPKEPVVSGGKARMLAGASKARQGGFPELAAYLEQMCPIPGGSFSMGSDTSGQSDEAPAHAVTLSDYWLGRHPVTVGVWKEYAKAKNLSLPGEPTDTAGKSFNPNWSLKDHPMVAVSREDIAGADGAGGFCAWASEVSGVTLTLPSEAQWEYAARDGGKARVYPWGDTFDKAKLRASKEKFGDSGGTLPVYRNTEIFMNSLGLIDMAGNVWQWCRDYYDPGFYGSAQATGTDPLNKFSAPNHKFTISFTDGTTKEYDGPTHVLRGGSWNSLDAGYFRCAFRGRYLPSARDDYIGFRLSSPGPR